MNNITQHIDFLDELSCSLLKLGCRAVLSQKSQDPHAPYEYMLFAKVDKHHLLKEIANKLRKRFKVKSIIYDPCEDKQVLTINLEEVFLHLMCECSQCITPCQSISWDEASMIV